jgi:hypothetical protein
VRRLALLMAGFGLARLFFWRRPEEPAQLPAAEPEPETDPRAEALRAKLAEAQETGVEQPAPEVEAPVDEPDLDERRLRVHEAARAAVEEMRSAAPDEP